MRFFYSLLGILLILFIAAFLIIPAFLPNESNVSVSSEINGPKAVVFDEFNNLKKQAENNSVLEQDSAISKLFYNPFIGQSANFKWNSFDPKIGSGDILITQSSKDSITTLVTLNEFKKTYTEYFNFDSISPAVTKVTWHRKGNPVSYFERYLLFLHKGEDQNEIYGSLQNTKEKVEANQYSDVSDDKLGVVKKEYFEGMKLLVTSEETKLKESDISRACKNGISRVTSFLKKRKEYDSMQISYPIVVIEKWDTLKSKTILDMGYAVNGDIGERPKDFKIMAIPANNVYTYSIQGNYADVDSIYNYLNAYVKKVKATPSRYFWIEDISKKKNNSQQTLKGYIEVNQND